MRNIIKYTNLFKLIFILLFMPLSQEIKYKPSVESLDDVSPKGVILMLREVRSEVSGLEPSFGNLSLGRVLDIVVDGKYEFKSDEEVKKVIDLSDARRIVGNYRVHSEGGCESCTSFGRMNSQGKIIAVDSSPDANSFWYCDIYERDLDKLREENGGRGGFSPMVKQYIQNPCGSWSPKFSPTIEKLIEMEERVNSN